MATLEELTFMTWNIRGLKTKSYEKRAEIERLNCHVAFIQETHIGKHETDVFNIFQTDGWKIYFTSYDTRSKGVAILIKNDVTDLRDSIQSCIDDAGCYVVVKCTLRGQKYTLVNVYNPQDDSRLLERLTYKLQGFAEGILLIGGDFNVALNPYLDKTSSTKNVQHTLLRPAVEKFITSFHLVDVWRRLNALCREYSRKPTSNEEKASINTETTPDKSRLDYVFVPEESMHHVKSCWISVDDCCSDHQPVLIKIRRNTINTPNDLNVIANTNERIISEFMSTFSQHLLTSQQNQNLNFYLTFSQQDIEKTLASNMAKWLNEHLDFHSTEYNVDKKHTTVLFTFAKELDLQWQDLQNYLEKEQKRNPPLPTEFNIAVLDKLLKNSTGEKKVLSPDCPLTPVLKRLCLTHAVEKFLESKELEDMHIHLDLEFYTCKENVIVRVHKNVNRVLLEKVENKLLHFKFVHELTNVQSQ